MGSAWSSLKSNPIKITKHGKGAGGTGGHFSMRRSVSDGVSAAAGFPFNPELSNTTKLLIGLGLLLVCLLILNLLAAAFGFARWKIQERYEENVRRQGDKDGKRLTGGIWYRRGQLSPPSAKPGKASEKDTGDLALNDDSRWRMITSLEQGEVRAPPPAYR